MLPFRVPLATWTWTLERGTVVVDLDPEAAWVVVVEEAGRVVVVVGVAALPDDWWFPALRSTTPRTTAATTRTAARPAAGFSDRPGDPWAGGCPPGGAVLTASACQRRCPKASICAGNRPSAPSPAQI